MAQPDPHAGDRPMPASAIELKVPHVPTSANPQPASNSTKGTGSASLTPSPNEPPVESSKTKPRRSAGWFKQGKDRKQRPRRVQRARQFESLEERIALTAQSLVDIPAPTSAIEMNPTAPAEAPHSQLADQQIQTQLASTNQTSGAHYIQQNYGFDGSGQTVAVIDTGIAWDHYALGGGFGEGYRVVGGWDFAENDANPYDDGPAGYHGTHVSGIIGSSDATHTGVASGADLVALRVFNDAGQSKFEWIEQALQWVHDNQNQFENPITTVNLSLGVNWNSDNIPDWAMLEDELAMLEEDGIFISVAAGNFFQNYQDAGLSYPASSPHVVPVASHGADGQLSDFSQRNERVIAAPGEDIYSTVPDHLYMGAKTGQFLRASGTSMAAPYLAGASTLIREAYAFMGHGEMTQDQIYEHFQDTATRIFDSATNAWYNRMDLQAAIDAIVTDAHADQWGSGTPLGTLGESGLSVAGTIGQFSDIDVFEFRAESAGRVSIQIDQSHDLISQFKLADGSFEINDGRIEFDVSAGQRVQFSLATQSGIGHYEIQMALEASDSNTPLDNAVRLGAITDLQLNSQSLSGDSWYQFSAGREGLMSLATSSNFAADQRLEIYDSNLNLISSLETRQVGRLDVNAVEGQEFLLRVVTSESDAAHDLTLDLRLQNLVSLDAGVLNLSGTDADDTVRWQQSKDGAVEISINGVSYDFDAQQVSQVNLAGGSGDDRLSLDLADRDGELYMARESASFRGTDGLRIEATGFETQQAQASSPLTARMSGTSAADTLVATGNWTSLSGRGYTNRIEGFSEITVDSGGGTDLALVYGSRGNDQIALSGDGLVMSSEARSLEGQRFRHHQGGRRRRPGPAQPVGDSWQ